jgi:hypothetical protein
MAELLRARAEKAKSREKEREKEKAAPDSGISVSAGASVSESPSTPPSRSATGKLARERERKKGASAQGASPASPLVVPTESDDGDASGGALSRSMNERRSRQRRSEDPPATRARVVDLADVSSESLSEDLRELLRPEPAVPIAPPPPNFAQLFRASESESGPPSASAVARVFGTSSMKDSRGVAVGSGAGASGFPGAGAGPSGGAGAGVGGAVAASSGAQASPSRKKHRGAAVQTEVIAMERKRLMMTLSELIRENNELLAFKAAHVRTPAETLEHLRQQPLDDLDFAALLQLRSAARSALHRARDA